MNKNLLYFVAGAAVAAVLIFGYQMFSANMVPTYETPKDTSETTNTSSPTSSGTSAATPGNPVPDKYGHSIYTVTYNNSIFNPAVLTVLQGDSVKWVNKDNLTMRISAIPEGLNPTPVTDSQSRSKGGIYTFSFTTKGTWIIRNINSDGKTAGGGVVYVK